MPASAPAVSRVVLVPAGECPNCHGACLVDGQDPETLVISPWKCQMCEGEGEVAAQALIELTPAEFETALMNLLRGEQ